MSVAHQWHGTVRVWSALVQLEHELLVSNNSKPDNKISIVPFLSDSKTLITNKIA